mgnify:CR=1 FL=1
MLYHKYKPLAARVYCTGLALLLVLSEVYRIRCRVSAASCGWG